MYKQAACLAFSCFLSPTFAAEALLSGEGQVLTEPDYVEMIITVESKCYPTPEEASKQNDAAARKIVDFLNTKISQKDAYNRVVSQGGVTSSYQNYQRDKVLCQNTFQKQNHITFRTQAMHNFEILYNEIQSTVLKSFNQPYPDNIDNPISYVTISQPEPKVTPTQRAKLEQNAIALAYQDAKMKLFSLFDNNQIRKLKVIEVSEFPPEDTEPFHKQRGPMMMKAEMGVAGGQAPVQFGEQPIHKTLFFKFQFEDIVINAD